MPWHIETGRDDCDGYAVVKNDDGELEGCHRTRANAEDQIAALYASEDDDEDLDDDGQRLATGPAAILVDIDGTLVAGSAVNGPLVTRLNNRDTETFVVTGRLDSTRDAAVALLERIGLRYSALYMNPGGDSNTHKEQTARRLLERFNVVLAVDDNERARAIYENLGIATEAPQIRRAIVEEIRDAIRDVR